MTTSISKFSIRFGVIWAAILIGSTLAAMLIGLDGEAVPDDGPLSAGLAFLFVNALHALVLAAIAVRSVLSGWKLGILLGATLFLAQSFLLLIEAVYFAGSVDAPLKELFASGAISLTSAICIGVAATILWRQPNPESSFQFAPAKLVAPVAAVALLYVVSYFTAGYFIAWAVPEVRTYYGDGLEIQLLPLVSFQVFRGMIWALLAFALVRSMKRGMVMSSLIVGAAFSVLAAAQLLYPNAFMPWNVRLPHLIEVGVSNFLFGALAGLVLQKAALSRNVRI